MNIQVIHEHSVDVDLLTGGICIDVGCRGFAFSKVMKELGCNVVGFDLEAMTPPDGVEFMKMAVSTYNGTAKYADTKDAQAKHLSEWGTVEVPVIELNLIYRKLHDYAGHVFLFPPQLKNTAVDVLKIDAEGEEYRILSDPEFKPIPRQISVEFHMHCHRSLHDQYYDKCMENLLKHYVAVQHELKEAHGAGLNYWDSLWIRKDLIKNI
jgi:hypothetical protein